MAKTTHTHVNFTGGGGSGRDVPGWNVLGGNAPVRGGRGRWGVACLAGLFAMLASLLAVVGPAVGSVAAQGAVASFVPDVAISVPQVDANGDGVNDFSGFRFAVTFSGSGSGCSGSVSGVWVVGDTGGVSLEDPAFGLVARDDGGSVCSYVSTAPSRVGDLAVLFSSARVRSGLSVESPGHAVSYVSASARFSSSTGISVPQTDANGDGVNDFAGTRFNVNFEYKLVRQPLSQNRAIPLACTASGAETYVVNNDGSVRQVGGPAQLLAYAPEVGVPVTNQVFYACSYSKSVIHNRVGSLVLDRSSSSSQVTDSTVSGGVNVGEEISLSSTGAASLRYVAVGLSDFFNPNVTVSLVWSDVNRDSVHDLSGKKARVSYAPTNSSGAGCSQNVSETFVVQDNGTVVLEGPAASLRRHANDLSGCRYNVNFPNRIQRSRLDVEFRTRYNSQRVYHYTPLSDTECISSTAGSIRICHNNPQQIIPYTPETLFTPNVQITVPQVDANRDGINDYAGTEFEVDYNSASGLQFDCGNWDWTYVVQNNGLVEASSSDPHLIERLAGRPEECVYDIVWPIVAGLARQLGATTTVQASSPTVSVVYEARADATFTPNISITVPQVDADGDGINDYAGDEIKVTFSKLFSRTCSNNKHIYYYVQNSGEVTTSQPDLVLVDRPSGARGGCIYDVYWERSAARPEQSSSLVRTSGTTNKASASTQTVAITYVDATGISMTTPFNPAITINVPQTDFDGDGINDFAGTSFTVTFSRSISTPLNFCDWSETATYTVQNNGNVMVSGSDPSLVSSHFSSTSRCRYRVTWPRTMGPLSANPSIYSKTISASSPAVTIDYSAPTFFKPNVAIAVTQLDSDGDRANDFSGTSFEVIFRTKYIHSRPVIGCSVTTAGVTATGTYVVQDNGDVTLSGPEPVLMDIPARGNSGCTYSVAWPDVETSLPNVRSFERQQGFTETVEALSPAVSAEYYATTLFTPVVSIFVLDIDENNDNINDLTGTSLRVTFSREFGSNTECTKSESREYIVQDNGEVIETRAVVLVDRPAGETVGCVYNVSWGVSWMRIRVRPQSSATATVQASSKEASAGYGLEHHQFFRPDISISVPNVDANRDGLNDFLNTQFVVTFTRKPSSASCTAVGTATYRATNSSSAMLINSSPRLMGVRAGSPNYCEYSVTWPTVPGWILITGTKDGLGMRSPEVSAVYEASDGSPAPEANSFSPNVSITVPQTDTDKDGTNDFAGTSFVVTFRRIFGSSTGCSDLASEIYTVGTKGTVALSSEAASLVYRPAGVIMGCTYVVTWPTVAGLARPSGATTTVSAFARSAVASYSASVAATSFSPDVQIRVQRLDADGDGVSDFSGTSFTVTFMRVAGANSGCTASASRTYVVQENGRVTGSDPSLVDHPAGVPVGCAYSVTWPIVAGLARPNGAMATVSASARSAAASYRVTAATSFSPDVTITVPRLDSNNDSVNDFSGTSFAVTFRPVFGSNSGCSAVTVGTYVVQDSGSVSGSGTSLVDRPAGVSAGCAYVVTWPSVPGLARAPGSTTVVQASARSIAATYRATSATSFSPDVRISVPPLDRNNDRVSDLAGTSFVVVFRRVAGSDADCTASASGTYVVQNNSSVSGVDPALVDRPAGATSGCSYDVVWPTVAGLVHLTRTSMVNASSRSASAGYRGTNATYFSPDVQITVPRLDADGDGDNDFAGTSFVVTFRDETAVYFGCTASASGTYVVQDNGSVSGVNLALVDRPSGVTTSCSYDVVWPTVTGLVRQSGATAMVSASAGSASASYRATAASSFSPNVAISVPQADADGDGANDFAGTSFVVTFRRVFGSDAGCSASASGTYLVRDNGSVSGSDLLLVDRPAGVTSGCAYAVVWPVVADLVRQSGATAWVRSSSRAASATYETSPSYVAPAPVVVEPEVDEPETQEPTVEPVVEDVEVQPVVAEAEGPAVQDAQSPDSSPGGNIGTGGGADTGAGTETGTGTTGGGNTGAGSGSSSAGGTGSNGDSASVPSVPEVGVVQLARGWVMLPFNGPSGMSPADFAQALEDAIDSVWVWDMSAQQWTGWTSSRGALGLDGLVPGDVVMVYVPTDSVVVYSPADLLGHRSGVNSWMLAPSGISLVVYGGDTTTSATNVFANYANAAVVAYLWDSQNQRWEYHLPGRQPLSSVQVPWFTDINPGDAMFVYNISPSAVTIPWQ